MESFADELRLRRNTYQRPRSEQCEICGRKAKKICYDHDHQTGVFRGWICDTCNMALGYAHDDPTVLRRMAEYVETNRKEDTA